jgi:hypothetical protein
MQKLCTQCFYACEIKDKTSWNPFLIAVIILVGFPVLPLMISAPAAGLPFLTIIAFILLIYYSLKKRKKNENNTCPKCLNDTMIPLEHEIAQKIIKDNQLNVEEIIREDIAIKEQKAKYPWQTY